MSTISKTDATYVMGHQAGEEVRLQKLGLLLYPSTRYLFEKAGIEPGMKVLDVGSGAGDVYPTELEVARARVRAARLNNITFIADDIRKISLDNHFDAVVGRNVLMYVADPAEVLRICADHLQPGGVMAFQEVEWSITERVDSMPSVAPLVQQAATWMIGGFRKARAERKRIENDSVCVTVPRYQCWRSP